MGKIQIKFANQIIELVCSDEDEVTKLALQLNERIGYFSKNRPNYSAAQLAFFTSLMLQKELNDLRSLSGADSSTCRVARADREDSDMYAKNDTSECTFGADMEILELRAIIDDLLGFIEKFAQNLVMHCK